MIQVLLEFGGVVERASVDEAYVDLTRYKKFTQTCNGMLRHSFATLEGTNICYSTVKYYILLNHFNDY